jgi:hypothetical protein
MNEKEDIVLQITGKITQFYFPEPNHPILYKSQRLFFTLIWFFCIDFPAYSPSSSSPSSQYDFCLIIFLIENEKLEKVWRRRGFLVMFVMVFIWKDEEEVYF